MVYGLTIQQPRLLLLSSVIHDGRRTNVQTYDYVYDDGFDSEEKLTRTLEYEYQPTFRERRGTGLTIDDNGSQSITSEGDKLRRARIEHGAQPTLTAAGHTITN